MLMMPQNDREEKLHKVRILFVEDNDISRELLQRLFARMENLKADLAGDGEEAIRLTQQNEYDIIFMDIQLPVMNGYETTRIIRQKEVMKGKHTPVIAVTAYVGGEDRFRCNEAGMDDFIPKPVSTSDLLEKISEYVTRDETSEPPSRLSKERHES
jgi:two-component system, OmpR family, aerobic respiration control sensor histidine kinase ArcB